MFYIASRLEPYILEPYIIVLNLEYFAHKMIRPDNTATAHLFWPSLKKALYMIETLNLKSIRLLLDLIHWFVDGASIDWKDVIDVIGLVHLCDYPHHNTHRISDLNLVLLFEGTLPLDLFLSSLRKRWI